jgi:hypothetical protein
MSISQKLSATRTGTKKALETTTNFRAGTEKSSKRAVQEGSADAVACLPVPRALLFPSFLLFAGWSPLVFLQRIFQKSSKMLMFNLGDLMT